MIAREGLFPPDTRALVMVSGGQDSLALLHLLATGAAGRKGPASLHALHINHHLRGPESDADEALVVRACARMAVDVTVVHRPVEKTAGNVQEAARDARREAALAVASENGCGRIVLGHTADDQVETMLYRLGRYGGLAAFAGMLPNDPPWVRPLLGCRREETAAYCRDQGLEFAEDQGNAYPGYARTAIRETVLPAWEAGLPGAVDAACRAAEVAAEIERVVAGVLEDAARRVGVRKQADASDRARRAMVPNRARAGGELSGTDEPSAAPALSAAPPLNAASELKVAGELSTAGLLGLEPAVRRLLLHAWLEARAKPAASRAAVLAVESLLDRPGSAERALGGGWRACKEYDRVFLERGPRQTPAVPDPVPLLLPGEARWGGVVVRAEQADRFAVPDIATEAYVDARCLEVAGPERGPGRRSPAGTAWSAESPPGDLHPDASHSDESRAEGSRPAGRHLPGNVQGSFTAGPLIVRAPRPGDRFRPLGAPGERKLQDLLVDLKVPARERSRWPLVVCDERIVWVCGLAVAEEGRIGRETTAIIRLSVSPDQDRSAPGGLG
jgi:tRNA(Ile)-lysidine synthase